MFWYNGQLIQADTLELAIDDPGLLYGATVFTTLRVYQRSLTHRLTNWDAHCDRLCNTLQTLGWQMPDWERLRQGAKALLPSHTVLRITLFPDGREWITGRSLPGDLTQRQQQGGTAWLANAPEFHRALPTHKTGNYLGAWLALTKARQLGAQEAILIDADGCWLETSTGNLWGWKDGCWWTPPDSAALLPGVVRSQLLDWLQRLDLPVGQCQWDRDFVQSLQAVAYTNSVVEVIPLQTIITQHGTRSYDVSHPALEQLQSFFWN